ncbi:his Kinase A domain protein [[Clostridium] bifermentans ATCC 638]|uniref:histidine kinase n=1 Tax=Paraclostridium bifermentans ATCC 638 = DSM 14991 TaxID=1233171 RepID=T4VMV7_PARBF|nr:sensor histidine kinase [Paraclostridium bifermentans]EQK41997.1 his Kinase A domain protein [[Clostridium] bifermentans ATCC 638] [Paraclostridium bifermentans ATCC 638 = DSM 14991]RIZ59312.1 sensor histidine kinase [Paraclostridium bifermentans]UAG18869.1 sensor histidine kinase [Paraclostridium bifermentans]
MKKTNKKILKFITLIILLISTAIFGASLQELRFGDAYQYTRPSNLVSKSNSIYAKNFFESDMFDNSTLQNILHNLTMFTSNTQMRSEEEIVSAKNAISEFKDIKFFVMNDSTGVSYSNTKYRNNEEFRKNQKGYVNLEIDFSNDMSRYTKIIDSKRSSYRVNRDLFWGVPKDNLTISMSFPKESSNDGYNSILFDGNYSSFEYYKNLSNKLNKVLIASAISSIISLILLIKNKEKLINKEGLILKLYAKIPLEIYTFIFIVLGIFSILDVSSRWSVILKFIFLSFVFIWIICFINLDKKTGILKNSITYRFGRFFTNVITNTINYSKKVPLIKRLILLDLLILMCTTFILMFFKIQFYSISFRIVMFILTILSLVLFIVTGYTINRLAYIDEIIEGTEKIKNGDINHKIRLRDNNSLTILAENINNLSDGLENAIEETLKSERMKTELITNVSHDLKTPLTSIINYVDLIKKEENIQPEYVNDYINILDNKSKRLKNLIEDLFEASKASSGNIDLNIERLDLNQLLRQSIGENEEKLIESNLSLKLNIPKEPVYINCDGRRMYRVFENLLVNISKYSHENTRVYVDMVVEGNQVFVSMKNISAYELNFEASEILERFKRGDLARNTEGSGLGLAIARDLVQLQGGKLGVQIDGDLFKVELSFNTI